MGWWVVPLWQRSGGGLVSKKKKKRKVSERHSPAWKGREMTQHKVEWHKDRELGIGKMCVRCKTPSKCAAKSLGGMGACMCICVRRWMDVQQRHLGHCRKERKWSGPGKKTGEGEGREKPSARGSYIPKLRMYNGASE